MSFLIYDCDSLRAKQNVKWLVKILTWQAKCVLGHFSLVQLIVIPWTVPRQAPLSIGFSRQEYWSGLPCPPPRGIPNPGIEPRSPTLQAESLLSEPPGKPENTTVGSLSLLHGIFLTQESNPLLLCLLHWLADSLPLAPPAMGSLKE